MKVNKDNLSNERSYLSESRVLGNHSKAKSLGVFKNAHQNRVKINYGIMLKNKVINQSFKQ
jgi:hypothetical protein